MGLYAGILRLSPMGAALKAGKHTHCVPPLPCVGTIVRNLAFGRYLRSFFAPRWRESGTICRNLAFVPYAGRLLSRQMHALRVTTSTCWNYMRESCICPPRKKLLRSALAGIWNYMRESCICPLWGPPLKQGSTRTACHRFHVLELYAGILHLSPMRAAY